MKVKKNLSLNKFANEALLVEKLLKEADFLNNPDIAANAEKIVTACRSQKSSQTKLDAFLAEYGLSNKEGVALMCLAESLLRIPDNKTRDELIEEKLSHSKWQEHLNKSDSLLVNAATWGLLIAGKIVKPKLKNDWLEKLVAKSGETPIREAVLMAMQILSKEFVCASDINHVKKLNFVNKTPCSFDMLGEAARNSSQAQNYFHAYEEAIIAIGALNENSSCKHGISIKLSALEPNYFTHKESIVIARMLPKIIELCKLAASLKVEITIDAEEQDRLSLSILVFEAILENPELKDWQDIGLAVQAYGRRAMDVINFMEQSAQERPGIHVRLVKGAYWDYEIKQSQIKGYESYPVFTSKDNTDLNYLVCAKKLIQIKELKCKFATHNAHTIAAVYSLANQFQKSVEFQRLFGMGELIYKNANSILKDFPKVSIYAPVGAYKDLLPYLVRRLLENGANSSFVNRLFDKSLEPKVLITSPLSKIAAKKKTAPSIPNPELLFKNRLNSQGFDMSEAINLEELQDSLKGWEAFEFKAQCFSTLDVAQSSPEERPVIGTTKKLGTVETLSLKGQQNLSTISVSSTWKDLTTAERAKVLHRVANALEENRVKFLYLLINEAGKNLRDAVDEVREAVDFLRYYAEEAKAAKSKPQDLEGPTGESNMLEFVPKGIFVSISPWNFPLAITCGQIAGALVCGNTVIAKPSEYTPLIAGELVATFVEAGLPHDAIHLFLGDGKLGHQLTQLPNIHGVAFTGSLATAKKIHQNISSREGAIIPLIAETGGLNAMVIDSSALLEQTCDDVIRSAFGSAGQRCSALRVALIDQSVFKDFWGLLTGAMSELSIGASQEFATDIGPIISENMAETLKEYINSMHNSGNEIFAVDVPQNLSNQWIAPTLIKINSLDEINEEKFGPILHILPYKTSELPLHLKAMQAKGFGLTLGIQSRIEGKEETITKIIKTGNTYINRDTIGAVVGSQPFGGIGKSGTGFKAGGPHYLLQFMDEVVITTNTVAFGGNADLLNLEEEN